MGEDGPKVQAEEWGNLKKQITQEIADKNPPRDVRFSVQANVGYLTVLPETALQKANALAELAVKYLDLSQSVDPNEASPDGTDGNGAVIVLGCIPPPTPSISQPVLSWPEVTKFM